MIAWETLLSSRFFTHKRGKSVAWIPFCMFLAVGCQFQDNRNLTGGYRQIRMNGCEVRIASQDGNIDLDGSVNSYAVRAPYVTGYADTRCIDADSERKAPGYFLIDTRTHTIRQTMSEEEWRSELRKIGWDHPDLNIVRRTKS
jgi:hypothetical protein